MWSAT
jgi:hypothetical protein